MNQKRILLGLTAMAVMGSAITSANAAVIDDHFTGDLGANGWLLSTSGTAAGLTQTATQSGSLATLSMANTSGSSQTKGVGILNSASPVTPATDFAAGVTVTTTFGGGLDFGKQYRLGLTQNTTANNSANDQVFIMLSENTNGVSLRVFSGNNLNGGTGVWLTGANVVGDASVDISAGDELRLTLTDSTVSASFYDVENDQEYVAHDNTSLGYDLAANWDTANAYTQGYLFGSVPVDGSISIDLDRTTTSVVPEPSSMALVGIGLLLTARRKTLQK